jgi:NADH-quinone oxidoreductase subunit A
LITENKKVFFRDSSDLNAVAFIFIAEIIFFLPFIYMGLKFLAPMGLAKRNVSKLSPYECGFSPFSLRRSQVDIKFFLIAIIFLVFDIEILIIVPFAISFYECSFYELTFIFSFLLAILLGVIFEIKVGTLTFL